MPPCLSILAYTNLGAETKQKEDQARQATEDELAVDPAASPFSLPSASGG